MESPGVAFIIIEKEGLSPSQRLVNEVFATQWSFLVITTLLAVLGGIIIWFLVRNNLFTLLLLLTVCCELQVFLVCVEIYVHLRLLVNALRMPRLDAFP